MCRYSDAPKVVVLINLQSHTCKEIRSVRLVPASVSTQSVLGVHLIPHRTAQSLSCEPLLDVCSHFQSGPHMLVKICRFGHDGMSLVFKSLQPKQDVIQAKIQCST